MSVRIVEVGPRDGLQNWKDPVPTSTKLELIQRLAQTGLDTIELTSVVSRKAIPQLADCREVLSSQEVARLVAEKSPLRLPVLVPNTKGLDIAQKFGVKEVAVFISATEGFSKANINCSVRQGIDRARAVAEKARGNGMVVRGYVSCIFADPYDGPTPPTAVLNALEELFRMGCYEVSLGDTLGVGTPAQVRSLVSFLLSKGIPVDRLAGHFHNTYGQAVANVWQAYNMGIRGFDSSVSGLGGCPFAPGAKGNVATEDIVYMFHESGIDTGVDLRRLVETGVWISQKLNKRNDSHAGAALCIKQKRQRRTRTEMPTQTIKWSPMTTTDATVLTYRSGANLKVVLNRPRSGNALTIDLISSLIQVISRANDDASISRIIITARGSFFCAGMDLSKDTSAVGREGSQSDSMFEALSTLLHTIDNSPKVTIAAINGPAFGGGIGLAFVCDIRIAVTSATFSLSEVRLGLCPATISKYVIREWGIAFTREAMLSARAISAEELRSHGVIALTAETSNQLEMVVDEMLLRLRRSAPNASRMVKELVRLQSVGGEKQDARIQSLFQEMMHPDSEGAYGVQQFQAKKAVDWDLRTEGLHVEKSKL